MQAQTFDSADLGQVEAFVSGMYSRMRIGGGGEHTRARITRRLLTPEVGFDVLHYSFDIEYSAAPPDLLFICDVVSSTIHNRSGRSDDTFGPGDQFLLSRLDQPYSGVTRAATLRFAVLDPAVLARVAATEDRAAGPVRILDHRPVSQPAKLRLQRAIAYVRDEVMTASAGPVSPMLASTASQLLAASVLQTYPNTLVGESATDSRDASPSTVQRGVAFIESNADLGITLADIARAAYVTPRALQLAFRWHLGTTPLAYLRRVRLDRAHHDLRTATPGRTTVAAIAERWGFTPARFARHYRAGYGQVPSRTLHE